MTLIVPASKMAPMLTCRLPHHLPPPKCPPISNYNNCVCLHSENPLCMLVCTPAAMETGKSSPLDSMKLKKQPHSPAPSDRKEVPCVSSPGPNPLSVKTPGKRPETPQPLRHRRAALSIKEVKREALRIREKSADPPARIRLELGGTETERAVRKKKKSADSKASFPEKYELLEKFFNSLDSSIRLLQLKRSSTTFTNMSSQIECLTDRRFTYSHLAQLKFIIPEAIVIEKVLRLDERTSCMKPDLHISLNAEAIECKSGSKCPRSLQLRKVFRGRLFDFIKSHPEGDEVPEEALPEPFGRLKQDVGENHVHPSVSSLIHKSSVVIQLEEPTTASHLSSSFKRRFSQRGPSLHSESIYTEQNLSGSPSGIKISAISAKSDSDLGLGPSDVEKCSLLNAETPLKHVNSRKYRDQISVGMASAPCTPVEFASTPAKLMGAPVLHSPKRCYMSPDDTSCSTPCKLVRRPPANRPLKFDTPVKSEVVEDKIGHSRNSSSEDDIFDILPESILQSILEKERLTAIAKDPAISQAKWRRQMIACLPKLFDTIYFLFQSMRRSVITKEELIQKIVSSHLDVLDRKEVEEQLRLLQELVPEWISEKTASTGDLLFCVNKISRREEIRIRLSEAK